MQRFTVDRVALLSYMLACVLLYLAGMSFGGALEFLFYGAAVFFAPDAIRCGLIAARKDQFMKPTPSQL